MNSLCSRNSIVSQLLTRVQDLQNKDAREFVHPGAATSSGASHVPRQPVNIPSPRGVLSGHSGLPDTLNSMGSSGNVLQSPLAREGPSSALFENSKNVASSSCGLGSGNTMEHGRGVRREPQSSSIPTPRCDQGLQTLNPLYQLE